MGMLCPDVHVLSLSPSKQMCTPIWIMYIGLHTWSLRLPIMHAAADDVKIEASDVHLQPLVC